MSESKKEIKIIPLEFVQRIESDLNRCTEWLPDILEENHEEIKEFWNYQNVFEFLVGWSIGTCQGSYLQAFESIYEKTPSLEQMMEIRKMTARRKIQFEQGVKTFLKENSKKTDDSGHKSNSIWIQTPLHYFGFKCAMSKHDLCTWKKCQCMCHSHN